MVNGNSAEAAIIIRAVNEASEELEQIQQDTDETSESLFGLSRNAIAGGIAALGLSFGLKELVGAASASAAAQGELLGTVRLLAPALEEIIDDAEPFFRDFANQWATTQAEVEGTAAVIIRNAGNAITSQKDLEQALLATAVTSKISGADMATSAAAVGQAMQGNLGPINSLLDGTGRSVVEFSDLLRDDLVQAAEDSVTPWDRFLAFFKRMPEEIARDIDELLEEFAAIGRFFVETVPNWATDAFNAVVQSGKDIVGWFTDTIVDGLASFFTETLPEFFRENFTPGEWLGDLGNLLDPRNLFSSNNTGGGGGGGGIQVIVNGNVDTPERAAEIARQVSRQMRETNRRGVNVSA